MRVFRLFYVSPSCVKSHKSKMSFTLEPVQQEIAEEAVELVEPVEEVVEEAVPEVEEAVPEAVQPRKKNADDPRQHQNKWRRQKQ